MDSADVKITLKATGGRSIVDSLDLNGRTQDEFMMWSLPAGIYKDY